MLNFGLGAVIPENEIIEKERYVNAACTKHVTYFELSCGFGRVCHNFHTDIFLSVA